MAQQKLYTEEDVLKMLRSFHTLEMNVQLSMLKLTPIYFPSVNELEEISKHEISRITNNKQSSVEYLIEQVKSKEWQDMFILHKEEIFKQAKQMEEDQLFEFWNGGINSTEEGGKSFDQFYEIYNKYGLISK